MTRWFPSPRKTVVICRRAQLDTTTKPPVDSLSPRRRSGERARERGFQLAAPIRWNVPLSPALSARASQGEGAGFHNGGGNQMRPPPPLTACAFPQDTGERDADL